MTHDSSNSPTDNPPTVSGLPPLPGADREAPSSELPPLPPLPSPDRKESDDNLPPLPPLPQGSLPPLPPLPQRSLPPLPADGPSAGAETEPENIIHVQPSDLSAGPQEMEAFPPASEALQLTAEQDFILTLSPAELHTLCEGASFIPAAVAMADGDVDDQERTAFEISDAKFEELFVSGNEAVDAQFNDRFAEAISEADDQNAFGEKIANAKSDEEANRWITFFMADLSRVLERAPNPVRQKIVDHVRESCLAVGEASGDGTGANICGHEAAAITELLALIGVDLDGETHSRIFSSLEEQSETEASKVDQIVLTQEIAEQYIADEDSFDLGEFTRIDDAAAESLAKHEGYLSLGGLTELSNAAAESLAKHKGGLDLNGLTELSDVAAGFLAKYEGELNLSPFSELSSIIETELEAQLEALKDKLSAESAAFRYLSGLSGQQRTDLWFGLIVTPSLVSYADGEQDFQEAMAEGEAGEKLAEGILDWIIPGNLIEECSEKLLGILLKDLQTEPCYEAMRKGRLHHDSLVIEGTALDRNQKIVDLLEEFKPLLNQAPDPLQAELKKWLLESSVKVAEASGSDLEGDDQIGIEERQLLATLFKELDLDYKGTPVEKRLNINQQDQNFRGYLSTLNATDRIRLLALPHVLVEIVAAADGKIDSQEAMQIVPILKEESAAIDAEFPVIWRENQKEVQQFGKGLSTEFQSLQGSTKKQLEWVFALLDDYWKILDTVPPELQGKFKTAITNIVTRIAEVSGESNSVASNIGVEEQLLINIIHESLGIQSCN